MNLDDLRAVQSRERATDSLQELRESFYEDAGEYVQSLRAERDRAASEATDPFSSPEVGRLTDEIEMAEQVVEAIYERRVGKIVKQASLAAAGMVGEETGLTPEEQALYDDLVGRIAETKGTVLDVLAGEESATDPATIGRPVESSGSTETAGGASTADPATPHDRGGSGTESADDGPVPGSRSAADATEDTARPAVEAEQVATPDGATAPETPTTTDPEDREGAGDAGDDSTDSTARSGRTDATARTDGTADGNATPPVDRTTVRITRDVGEIFGVDEQTYTLETEDVVSLPQANAKPLLDREAAERLDAPDPS